MAGTALGRTLKLLGLLGLGLLSAASLALSAAFWVVSTDLGRDLLVPRALRAADDALAGRFELSGFHLLARGGVELLGLRVVDPDGDLVLSVDRARVYLDVSRLRSRSVGVVVELDGPAAILKREEDGSLSLARAFALTHPRPPSQPSGPFAWTVRLTRLAVQDGSVRYADATGRLRFAAEHLTVLGRGGYGPGGGQAEASLRGDLLVPERASLGAALQASLDGHALRVPLLRASVGETALELVGEGDWVTWKGRAALLALAVDEAAVRDLAPRSPLTADLAGTLYAESNGQLATAALALAPKGGGGSARASAALRLPLAALAAGAEVRLAALDLSKVLRGAPPSAITLDAQLRASGADRASLRGGVTLSVAPSRLRAGRVQSIEARVAADRGLYDLQRLEAALPGARVSAQGRWRPGGELSGHLLADGADLAALGANLSALLARPLPALGGAARVEASLSGTEALPAAAVDVTSPGLTVSGVAATAVVLHGQLAGPLASPAAEATGTVRRVVVGGLDARAVRLQAQVKGRVGELDATADVPELGPDPMLVQARGALSSDGAVLALEALTLAWPGDRFTLSAPARVTLAGPSVDRLALADGSQRIALSGGLSGQGRRRALDGRLEVAELDLGRLPKGLLPPRLGLGGRISADLGARGPPAAPEVAGKVQVAEGAVAGVTGLAASGTLGWDGERRRARLDLTARRAAGGELGVKGELPVLPGRAPASGPIALAVELGQVPVADALRLLGRPEADEVEGLASVKAELSGTFGAPALAASASLAGGRWRDLDALALELELSDPGERAHLVARLDRRGARAAEADLTLPLDLAALLREPAPTARGIAGAPLRGTVTVPGLDLASLAGRRSVPEDLRGHLVARAEVSGTPRAPRGQVTAGLADGALAGYQAVAGSLELTATATSTSVSGRVALAGEELLRLTGQVDLPPERLGDAAAREAAPFTARLDVPGVDLRRADAPVPLTGEVGGFLALAGTLASARGELQLTGRKVEVSGRPLGDLEAKGTSDARSFHLHLALAVPMGGTLAGDLDAGTGLGLAAFRRGELLRAPARATLVAKALDLGFVPAVAPGLVRTASGKLTMDLAAEGPLERLVPRGTLALVGGKIAVAELGEWSEVDLSAALSDDVFRVERFTGRGKKGRFDFHAEAKGLARKGAPAEVTAALKTDGLLLARAGEELGTLTLDAAMTGTLARARLDAEVRVARAELRLPSRLSSRRIQPLGGRVDIAVGPFRKAGARAGDRRAPVQPFEARVRVVAANQLVVRGDNPRVDVEAKADLTAEWSEQTLWISGVVETLRGDVEPLGGRLFDLKRARVGFSGGEWPEGELDVTAVWTNPVAVVTASIGGTLAAPEVKLTSQPSLDETQIALLIATGNRTELKPDTGGVSPLGEAGGAALGALSQQFVKDVVADKLPVDTISVDASQLRAGKYLGPKLYVGYTRRWQARSELGENTNEVRLEYQISPRWNFEARAGDAGTGGGSLIWSKDY